MKLSEITPIQVLGGILVVNTVLASGSTQLTDLFGPAMANHILSVCILGSGICGGFIMQMGGLPSQARGVLAAGGRIEVDPRSSSTLATMAVSNDPTLAKIEPAPGTAAQVASVAKAAANILLTAFLLTIFLGGDPASAQTGIRKPQPKQTNGLPCDPANLLPGCKEAVAAAPTAAGQKIGNTDCTATGDPIIDLQCILKSGGQQLVIHLKQAYALSIATDAKGNMADETSSTCTKALVPLVELVAVGPKAGTIPDGDPMALTADEQAKVTADAKDAPIVIIEKIRILRLALQSPALNNACGALVQDEVKNAQDLVGKLTSLVTGAGIAGLPLAAGL